MSPIASNVKLTKTLRTVALLAAIALAAALGACSAPPAQEKAQQAQPEPLVVNDTPAPPVPDPEYILVIGDDSWEEYTPGHADLMMLMRLDFEKHLITLVSVPRDTAYVFPDGNTAKLNQMLTNAGPEAQCQAVSDVVGVDVSQYVVVGFDGLQSIVEHFGGLDVDLPYGLTYNFYTKDHPDEVYEAGPQTLTPWRTMALSRARTGYGDTGYQQEMIRQVVVPDDDAVHRAGKRSCATSALLTLLRGRETNVPLDDQLAWADERQATTDHRAQHHPYYGDFLEEAGGYGSCPKAARNGKRHEGRRRCEDQPAVTSGAPRRNPPGPVSVTAVIDLG
ncbi:MAG: LCP family protein [Eggerthella lenta]